MKKKNNMRKIKTKIMFPKERIQHNIKEKYRKQNLGKYFVIEKRDNHSKISRFIVRNLKEWCRDKGLNYGSMCVAWYRGKHWNYGYRIVSKNVHISDERVGR